MREIFVKSFSLTLLAMFFFISLINARTMTGNLLIGLSLFVNMVGIVCLGPFFLGKGWAYKPLSAWIVLYSGFLVFNVLSGWIVNTTGYLMLLLALSLVFLSRENSLNI